MCRLFDSKLRTKEDSRRVVNGRLSREGAMAIAAKFSSCPGLSEICHYSSGAPNETDGQPEIV